MNFERFLADVTRKRETLSAFLKKFDEVVPENVEELVAAVDKKVWKKVNCTECANCCKTMTPTYTKQDIDRIARHLGMTRRQFRDKWLRKDESGTYINASLPCQFLDGNLCSIYDVRPEDCADFPHHDLKPFDNFTLMYTANMEFCPATFTLIEKLKKTVERDYEWE